MSEKTGWAQIWKINGEFLRAAFGFGGAWVFWQMSGPGLEVFTLFAAAFAVGGAVRLCVAVFELTKALLSSRKWARFKAKGVDPKADKLAQRDDLKRAGLLK